MNILCLMNFCNNKKEIYDLPLPFQNISLNFIFTLLENSPTNVFEFTYMSSYKVAYSANLETEARAV